MTAPSHHAAAAGRGKRVQVRTVRHCGSHDTVPIRSGLRVTAAIKWAAGGQLSPAGAFGLHLVQWRPLADWQR